MIKIDNKEKPIESKLLNNILEKDYISLEKSVINLQQETRAKRFSF